jgi:ribosome-associated toxin RatA of RatAB toxin-antitoxin module
MSKTVDRILVRSDAETVFHLAAETTRWPSILPHYRWVKGLGMLDGRQKLEMAARRGWIPVKWTALQTVDTVGQRVYFTHIGGPTKGMEVEWSFEAEGDSVLVTIVHEMSLSTPVVRSALGRWIIGRFFVHNIAQRTLRRIKAIAEEGVRDNCVAQ